MTAHISYQFPYPKSYTTGFFYVENWDDEGIITLETIVFLAIHDWDDGSLDDRPYDLVLIEEKRSKDEPKWCSLGGDFPDKGDCGRVCDNYKPRNGRSGCCRFLVNSFIDTGRRFRLTKEGLRLL